MEQEDELVFRRFPAEKQDQVRQLVSYATLMGLSGKDLVSIGGKLDRLKQAVERTANMNIIRSFDCKHIGSDRTSRRGSVESALDERFKLKTANGTYKFESDYGFWTVTSMATKATMRYRVDHYKYALPTNLHWERRSRYALLLDISSNQLALNF